MPDFSPRALEIIAMALDCYQQEIRDLRDGGPADVFDACEQSLAGIHEIECLVWHYHKTAESVEEEE